MAVVLKKSRSRQAAGAPRATRVYLWSGFLLKDLAAADYFPAMAAFLTVVADYLTAVEDPAPVGTEPASDVAATALSVADLSLRSLSDPSVASLSP